jgi:dGTPase
MVSDLIDNTRRRIRAAGVETVDDVRRHPERLFAFSPEVDADRRHLKDFLYQNLYYSPGLLDDKSTAEQTIAELFQFFLSSPGDLPGGYHEKSEQEPLHRVVCDYIAGMTDSYVQQQHRKFLRHADASQ